MLKITGKRKKRERRAKWTAGVLLGLSGLFCVILLGQRIRVEKQTGGLNGILTDLILFQYTPVLAAKESGDWCKKNGAAFGPDGESRLDYDRILAKLAAQESEDLAASDAGDALPAQRKEEPVALEKLGDFDYLMQKFYTVDKTTTINSSQLDANVLLAKDCTMEKTTEDVPQILIYHTHSQEEYGGAAEGDASSSVVAVGDELTRILQDTYGYHVMHVTTAYDLGDRDHAYSKSAPDLERILSENPSIEVVIDLHRDAVGEETHLVTEIDGKPTAKIMFFNGLSRTTSTGDIDYLYNPCLEDNLAFSLKMQIAAAQLYPDFTRKIYLKGYRYNLHFRPKSMLVEVGAQTNTLEEAMNAMPPLAAVLDRVLSGKQG